jgi:Spy/CpxP family protein refolding chaperone
MKRTLALMTLLLATTLFADQPPKQRPPAPPPQANGPKAGPADELLSPPQMAIFLNLSDAQKASLQQINESAQAIVRPLAEQARANEDAIETAVKAGDAAKAGQLLVANYAIGQQIKAALDAAKTASDAVLTAEQKAKLAIYREIIELQHQRPAGPPA